jgi:hypothetical protein
MWLWVIEKEGSVYLSEVDVRHRLPRSRFMSPYLGQTPERNIPGLSPSEEKALRITSSFETGRPLGFGGLTGNFDGMGLSFGLMQWNIGSGSLQPLLNEFARDYPQRFEAVFGTDANAVHQMLRQPQADQLRWAQTINDSRNQIVQRWAGHFQQLESDQAFQQIQLRHVRAAMDQAIGYARQLGLRSERGLALMFDNVTQNGPHWWGRQNRAVLTQQRRADFGRQNGRAPQERDLLAIIANVVADTVLPQYREDVRSRRMTIVNGRGRVHGDNYDLERQFGLTDQPWEFDPIQAARQAAEKRIPLRPETVEERMQRILKEAVPALPGGMSFKDRLDRQMMERGVPKWLRDSIWKSFMDTNWGVMSNLLSRAGFSGAIKESIIEMARGLAETKVR